MHLILAGCEYSGTTTLAYSISQWAESAMGGHHFFHDHWKIPHVNHPPFGTTFETIEEFDASYAAWIAGEEEDPTRLGLTEDEQKLFLALSPRQKEMFQRYHMDYHVAAEFYLRADHNLVGMQIDEAVYAGLYYGGDGQEEDRKILARHIEERILEQAPDTVLVLLRSTPEVIRGRMNEDPHTNGLLQDKDVVLVLQRFEEEYERSLIKNKFIIDTSRATVEECLAEFVEKFEPFITDADRTRILVQKAKQRGEWLQYNKGKVPF